MNKTRHTTVPVIAFSIGLASFASAAVSAFSQTFYSTNTGLTSPSSNVVFTTPAGSNAEMHTGFTNTTINLGETFRINFNIAFNETNGLGGHVDSDGLRFGLLGLTTPTNADGVHADTTATGYSTRFNWTRPNADSGQIRPRALAGGTSINYLTTGAVYGNGAGFTGFGLTANGTAYDASYSVTRTTATANRVDFTIGGFTRSWTDASAAAFNFDTFVIAKIGDGGTFNTASTITLNSFSFDVVPEPSGLALLGCSAIGLILRRRR